MYRKLDDEAVCRLLETGIDEFAEHGLDRANINIIAKKADVSVGVIYKYYQDKDHFFLACVRHSLEFLDQVMEDVLQSEEDVMTCIRILVRDMMQGAAEHRNYYVMYNEITSGSCRKYAAELASEIEQKPPQIYRALIEKAQAEGEIHLTTDPAMFVFFFDNLLMMMHFSVSCDYYRERMKIFLGPDIFEHSETLEEAFISFISRAMGL